MKSFIMFLLAVLMLCPLNGHGQQLPPLKSLNVGNMWVYRLSPRLASDYGVTGEAIEQVVAKQVINGKEYARVYNSYTRSFRFERSDSNTIYVWNGTKDTIAHTTLWKVGDTIKFRMLWHGCDTCLYRVINASRDYDATFLKDSIFRFDIISLNRSGGSISFNYIRKLGLNQIDTNGIIRGNNGSLSTGLVAFTFLIGANIDGKALRDTSVITSIIDDPNLRLAQSKQGSTTTQAAQPRIAVALSAENPFSQRTQVRYRLERSASVALAVYNVQGVRLTTFAQGTQGAGDYTATWNGTNAEGLEVPSGTYYIVVFVNDRQAGEVKVIKQR